jgi:hypothetical protein
LAQLEGIHELEPDKFSLNMEACTLRKLTQDWKMAALYMVGIRLGRIAALHYCSSTLRQIRE